MEWLATAFFGEGHGCCDELARVEKSGRVRLKEMWRDAISDGDNADNVARRNRPLAVPSPLSCSRLPLSCAPPEPIFAYPRYLDGGKSKGGLHADWPAAPPLSLTPHASHPPPPLICFPGNAFLFWAAYYLQNNNIIITTPPLPPQLPRKHHARPHHSSPPHEIVSAQTKSCISEKQPLTAPARPSATAYLPTAIPVRTQRPHHLVPERAERARRRSTRLVLHKRLQLGRRYLSIWSRYRHAERSCIVRCCRSS